MKSTGEVMGKDTTLEKALYKGLVASGLQVKDHGTALITVADKDKQEALELAKRLHNVGYRMMATTGTAALLQENNIPVVEVSKIGSEMNLLDVIKDGHVQIVINTMTKGKQFERDGFQIRRESVDNGVPCLTSLDTARALIDVIESMTFSMNQM